MSVRGQSMSGLVTEKGHTSQRSVRVHLVYVRSLSVKVSAGGCSAVWCSERGHYSRPVEVNYVFMSVDKVTACQGQWEVMSRSARDLSVQVSETDRPQCWGHSETSMSRSARDLNVEVSELRGLNVEVSERDYCMSSQWESSLYVKGSADDWKFSYISVVMWFAGLSQTVHAYVSFSSED